eukprot:6956748-Heterocapsa_arctica.AAC.1
MPDPCRCKAFVFLHYHATGANKQDGTPCPPDQAIPFWERILDEDIREDEEEEARAVAEVTQERKE